MASETALPPCNTQNQSTQNQVQAIDDDDAAIGDDAKSTTSNCADCTSETQFDPADVRMQANNLDLPDVIDAMKIDQSMQQLNQEQIEGDTTQIQRDPN